jgi:lincosamide nucleotidyltransferase A/C/D/E
VEMSPPSGMIKQISAETVMELLQGFSALGVRVWLDGGWGVDALLGEQTRPHADLDIVVQKNDRQAIETFLRGRGYRDVPRNDTRAWNFVLGDMNGNEIDVHVIEVSDSGDGIYGPFEDGNKYPAAALTGIGSIAGNAVLCMSAGYQVANHVGYPPRARDLEDVENLCRRFGLRRPKEH